MRRECRSGNRSCCAGIWILYFVLQFLNPRERREIWILDGDIWDVGMCSTPKIRGEARNLESGRPEPVLGICSTLPKSGARRGIWNLEGLRIAYSLSAPLRRLGLTPGGPTYHTPASKHPNTQLLAYSSDTGGRVGLGQKLCQESRGSHRAERKPRRSAGDEPPSLPPSLPRTGTDRKCMHASQLIPAAGSQERVSRSHTQRPRVPSRMTSCSPTYCSLCESFIHHPLLSHST